jgi:hypothetical protein
LREILIDGVSLADFNAGKLSYDVQIPSDKSSVTVKGTPYASSQSVAYRTPAGGSGAWRNTNLSTGIPVDVPGSVEINVYRTSSGTNDSQRRIYTLILTHEQVAPGEWPWPELRVDGVEVDPDNFSSDIVGVQQTRVRMTVSDAYKSKIDYITVKGERATQIQVSARPNDEVWQVFVVGQRFTLDDLLNAPGDLEVHLKSDSGGIGMEFVEVVRSWPNLITKVEVRDFSVDVVGVTMMEMRITVNVPSGGTLRGITVYNEAATRLNDTTWRIRPERDVNVVYAGITANDISVDYDAPSSGEPQQSDLIESFTAAYFEFQGSKGYMINVELKMGVRSVLDDIVVVDAVGNEVVSVKSGTLNPVVTNRNLYSAQLDAAGLNERTGDVSVTVTTTDNRFAPPVTIQWDNTPLVSN